MLWSRKKSFYELHTARVLNHSSGGVHQRIDEHRALIELLDARVPQIFCECPWICDWLSAQDVFLEELAACVSEPPSSNSKSAHYPRPYPVIHAVMQQQIESVVCNPAQT
jgi:hypothetical protein